MAATARPRQNKKASVGNRLLFREPPTPTAARALLKLQFSAEDIERMHALSAKAALAH